MKGSCKLLQWPCMGQPAFLLSESSIHPSIHLSICCVLHISFPLKPYVENILPNMMVLGSEVSERWLAESSWMGLVPLENRCQRVLLPLPPCEDIVRRQKVSSDQTLNLLVLQSWTSRSVRNKCLLFKPPCLRYFHYGSLKRLGQEKKRLRG